VASAVIGVPVIFVLVLAGGNWYAAAAAAVIAVAALEFQHAHFGWTHPMSLLAAGFSGAMAGAAHAGGEWVLWLALVAVPTTLAALLIRFDANTYLRDWLWTAGCIAYTGLLGSTLVLLRDVPNGRDWVYLALFSTFAVDTSAYFTGRAVGRHKLAPRISPKKTVEGFAGGYAGGIAAAVLLNWALGLRIEPWHIAVLAALLPAAATLGDLAESAIKRSMHIKDASDLIPGHGGVLDRFDSLLFTFTLTWLFTQWVIA